MVKLKKILYLIMTMCAVVLAVLFGTQIAIETPELRITLEPSVTTAKITNEDGSEKEIALPSIEEIDGGKLKDCDGECGQGAYADVSTPQKFYDTLVGTCQNTDGHFGAQCWDLMDLAFQNMVGRNLSTCGTGAAKGVLECDANKEGFQIITDPRDIKVGDIVVLSGGLYGHIGMAMGGFNNGYVALFGQNQGGKTCEGGGQAANLVNINLKNFIGAFRWEEYVVAEPEPEPTVESPEHEVCMRIEVKEGDTLSEIMKRCEGYVNWNAMEDYAKVWESAKIKPGQTIWEGWNSIWGVGLYAGDIIERH